MATGSRAAARHEVIYPTSDGKPMAETQTHAQDLMDLIQSLQDYFAAVPDVYVWGNMLMFYEEGDGHKHVAPDVFVVRDVPKLPVRDHYLIWKEGKGPDVVIELTSKTTCEEDVKDKLALYRDIIKVPEYFLFDPFEEYLKPSSMQGYRLRQGRYVPIKPVMGRLPSAVLGLHLERDGTALRLFDPATGQRLPTPRERAAQSDAVRRREEEARRRAETLAADEHAARRRAETLAADEHAARRRAEAENERLRRELEELRRPDSSGT